MDVFDYRTNRTFSTEGVFVSISSDSEMGGLFVRLKNLMTTELHLQWDSAFLEQYLKDNMVPRGLRWDVHPQQGDLELDAWFRYFNEAGISFITFLLGKKRARLTTIDKDIKEIRDKLLPFKATPEYMSLSTNLKIHLEKEEREQKVKKQKKYTRDTNDYKTHQVFSWQSKDSVLGTQDTYENTVEASIPLGPPPPPLKIVPGRGGIPNFPKESRQAPPYTYATAVQHRGPPPQRQRGRGGRGNKGRRDHSRDYARQDSPHTVRTYGHHEPHQYQQQPQRTPVSTHNRFSPLREEGGPRRPYYNQRDDGYEYNRSPYNYNQNHPGPSYSGGFQKEQNSYIRSVDANEDVGAEGAPRKRKCV